MGIAQGMAAGAGAINAGVNAQAEAVRPYYEAMARAEEAKRQREMMEREAQLKRENDQAAAQDDLRNQLAILGKYMGGSQSAPIEGGVGQFDINKALGAAGAGMGGSGGFTPENFKVGGVRFERQPSDVEIERELSIDDRKNRMKEQSKARVELDKYASDAMQSLVAIDKIKEQAKNLGDFKRGFFPQMFARAEMAIRGLSKEQNLTRYLGVVAQELIPAARKLMEEKGPITEFDVARVEKGLGDTTTPLEDKIFLLQELENKVRAAVNNKVQIAGLTPEEFSGKYQELSGRLGGMQTGKSEYTVGQKIDVDGAQYTVVGFDKETGEPLVE